MPRFLIERNFAEEVEITKDDVDNAKKLATIGIIVGGVGIVLAIVALTVRRRRA